MRHLKGPHGLPFRPKAHTTIRQKALRGLITRKEHEQKLTELRVELRRQYKGQVEAQVERELEPFYEFVKMHSRLAVQNPTFSTYAVVAQFSDELMSSVARMDERYWQSITEQFGYQIVRELKAINFRTIRPQGFGDLK